MVVTLPTVSPEVASSLHPVQVVSAIFPVAPTTAAILFCAYGLTLVVRDRARGFRRARDAPRLAGAA